MKTASPWPWLRSALRALALLLGVVASAPAFADSRELYVLAEGGPTLLALKDTQTKQAHAGQLGCMGGVTAYYGLTDTIHVGLAGRFSLADNAAFGPLTVSGLPSGTLYENVTAIGGDAVFVYRGDTGYAFAPVARAQAGLEYISYSGQQLITADLSHATSFPDQTQVVLGIQLAVALEYRLSDHWVVSVGVAGRLNTTPLSPFQFTLPVTLGGVW